MNIESIIYVKQFLEALLTSITIETITLLFIWQLIRQFRKIPLSSILFVGIFCTLTTIPYLWFVLPIFIYNRLIFLAVGEVSVTLIEFIIIWRVLKIPWWQAFAISIVCNLNSCLLGMFVFK